MAEEQAAPCPSCSQDTGIDAAFCPHCGTPLRPELQLPGPGTDTHPAPPHPGAEVALVEPKRSPAYRFFQYLFTIWLIAYPMLACGSMLVGASTGGGASMAAVSGVVLGSLFLIPWLIGLLVLGLLLFLTR